MHCVYVENTYYVIDQIVKNTVWNEYLFYNLYLSIIIVLLIKLFLKKMV